MRNRMSNVCDRLLDFTTGIVNWIWDTFELVLDIVLEFFARAIELAIAILHLTFQIVCFLRDLCIEALQTFVNVFRGIVNVVSSIKCEDVEEFASACMVVILWIGAVKIAHGLIDRHKLRPFPNPLNLLKATTQCAPSPRDQILTPVKSSMRRTRGRRVITSQAKRAKRTMNSSRSSTSSVVSND